MSYGQVTDEQARAIQPFILGRVVHDLGCGDRYLSGRLVAWGASRVVAIDSHPFGPSYQGPSVTVVKQSFEEYLKTEPSIDVAFVSWPNNTRCDALLELVTDAKQVIYLGKNTDGVMCGSPALFLHLLCRPLLVHVPNEWNTLIVYGTGVVEREGVLEELAGADLSKVYKSIPTSYPEGVEEL